MSKERLTERNEANTAYYFPLCFEKCNGLGASSKCDRCEVIESVCEKLGEYEDLEDVLRGKLTDVAVDIITASKKDFSEWIDRILWTNKRCDELAREVEKYRELEEQGLILRLPCKVGDVAYHIINNTDACVECPHYSDFYGMDSMCSKTKGNIISEPRWKDMPICDDQFLEIGEMTTDLEYIVRYLDDFGKMVFLTKSEAEKKLRELEMERENEVRKLR